MTCRLDTWPAAAVEEEHDERQQTGLVMDAGHLGFVPFDVNPCRASLGFAAV
jgi:hypothetical protein